MKFHGVWGFLTLLSSAAVFFNPELKVKFQGLADLDVSRWWGLVPIAVLVVYTLLKTNHEKFVMIEAAKQEAETAKRKNESRIDEWCDL